MYEKKISPDPRILIIEFWERMTLEEAQKALQDVKDYVDNQRSPFVVISIISDLSVVSREIATLVKQGQEYIARGPVKKVIRVAKKVITKMQWDRSAKEIGYQAETVDSF